MTPDQRAAVAHDRIVRGRLWLIPCAILWVPLGIGTMNGLAGRPDDAPHLLVPGELRGWAWIITGLLALVILLRDKKMTEKATRTAAAILLVMPAIRAASYSVAGLWALVDLDGGGGLQGSPQAYYTSAPWILLAWAPISQAIDWPRVIRHHRRKRGTRRE